MENNGVVKFSIPLIFTLIFHLLTKLRGLLWTCFLSFTKLCACIYSIKDIVTKREGIWSFFSSHWSKYSFFCRHMKIVYLIWWIIIHDRHHLLHFMRIHNTNNHWSSTSFMLMCSTKLIPTSDLEIWPKVNIFNVP